MKLYIKREIDFRPSDFVEIKVNGKYYSENYNLLNI